MWQNGLVQKIMKIHVGDPEKNASQTDGQIDEWTNRTNFLGPLAQRWRFDRVFKNIENKIF